MQSNAFNFQSNIADQVDAQTQQTDEKDPERIFLLIEEKYYNRGMIPFNTDNSDREKDGYCQNRYNSIAEAHAVVEAQVVSEERDSQLQYDRATALFAFGSEEDDKEAVCLFRSAANQGHAGAQYNLGIIYQYGLAGTQKNSMEAIRLIRLSGEAKNHHLRTNQSGFSDKDYKMGENVFLYNSILEAHTFVEAEERFKKINDKKSHEKNPKEEKENKTDRSGGPSKLEQSFMASPSSSPKLKSNKSKIKQKASKRNKRSKENEKNDLNKETLSLNFTTVVSLLEVEAENCIKNANETKTVDELNEFIKTKLPEALNNINEAFKMLPVENRNDKYFQSLLETQKKAIDSTQRKIKNEISVLTKPIQQKEVNINQELKLTKQGSKLGHVAVDDLTDFSEIKHKSVIAETPLRKAVELGNISICKLLLEKKAAHTSADLKPNLMKLAIKNNHVEIVDLLLKYGHDPAPLLAATNKKQFNLFDAIQNKQYQIAKILIHSVNTKDTISMSADKLREKLHGKWDKKLHGITEFKLNALHLAILSKNIKLIDFLLGNNYHPQHKDNSIITPAQLANILGNREIIKLIQKHNELLKQSKIKKHEPTLETKHELKEFDVKDMLNKETSTRHILTTLKLSTPSDQKKDSSLNSLPKQLKIKELLTLLKKQEKEQLTIEHRQNILETIPMIDSEPPMTVKNIIALFTQLHELAFDLHGQMFVTILAKLFARSFHLQELNEILQCLNMIEFNKKDLSLAGLNKILFGTINQTLRKEQGNKQEIAQLFEKLADLEFTKADLISGNITQFLIYSEANIIDKLHICYEWKLVNNEFKDAKFNPISAIAQYNNKTPYNPGTASNVAYYLAHMRFAKKDVIASKQFLLSSLLADEFSLSLRLWPLARLGFTQDDFEPTQLNQLANEFKKNLTHLSKDPKASALILWSLAAMNFDNKNELYNKYAATLINSINQSRPNQFDTATINQILQAQLWFGFTLEEKHKNYFKKIIQGKKPDSSKFHVKGNQYLTQLFQKANFPPHENEALISGVLRVDMCLEELKVVIEFDGPEHHPVTDALKDKLLKKAGYDVIRISYQDVDFSKENESRSFLMQKVIEPCKQGKQKQRIAKNALFEEQVTTTEPYLQRRRET